MRGLVFIALCLATFLALARAREERSPLLIDAQAPACPRPAPQPNPCDERDCNRDVVMQEVRKMT